MNWINKPKKINIFDLMKKSYPLKSNINTPYTMYRVNITKKGDANDDSNIYINRTRKNIY